MSDVITNNVTATEQTGAVNPADAIAAMIAFNRSNAPQSDNTAPPAGQVTERSVSPEAAPDEEAEPEDSSIETTETVDAENEDEAEALAWKQVDQDYYRDDGAWDIESIEIDTEANRV